MNVCPSGKIVVPVRIGSFHRHRAGKAGRGHAGNRRQLVHDVVLRPRDAFRIRAPATTGSHDRKVWRCSASRESRLDVAQSLERADHQPRAHQQHQRHRHLRHHQDIAGPMSLAARAERASRTASAAGCRGPAYFKAGISPNSSPDSSESARLNPSARGSIEISFRRGKFAGRSPPAGAAPHTPAPYPARRPSAQHHAFDQQLARRSVPSPRPAPLAGPVPAAAPPPAPAADSPRSRRRSASPVPMVPITTHRTSPTLPTTSCFSGRSAGVILQSRKSCGLLPGPFGQESIQTGSSRAMSAFGLRDSHSGLEPPDALKAEARQDHAAAIECERQNQVGLRI